MTGRATMGAETRYPTGRAAALAARGPVLGLNDPVDMAGEPAVFRAAVDGSHARKAAGAWSASQVADYLTDGFWHDLGYGRHSFDVRPGGVIRVDVSGLTPESRRLALEALDAWHQVTGIEFQRSTGDAEAHIIFKDTNSQTSADTRVNSMVSHSITRQVTIHIPTSWLDSPGTGFASYEYQVYIHEIGHALGLGHAGNYNGSAHYGSDNLFANDSWQMSVMSYFDQTDNTVIHASLAYAITPMPADILAIHRLFGTPQGMQGGDSIWGVGDTVGGALGRALRLVVAGADVTATVFDQGGHDVLNLSTDMHDQRVDLRAGKSSDVGGLIGNLSIAPGTLIEDLVGGRGNDSLRGNKAANRIAGGEGNDTLMAGGGNDTLTGQGGADCLIGGPGDDCYVVDDRDRLFEAGRGGDDLVIAGVTWRLGANIERLSLTGRAAIDGRGNGGDNLIAGNTAANRLWGGGGDDEIKGGAGDDQLTGGAGRDTLSGGAGDDIYVIDRHDRVIEAAAGGIDTIRSHGSIRLPDHVERATLLGHWAANLVGNDRNNTLEGNDAANRIAGGGGRDEMTGGGGRDVFVFAPGDTARVLDFEAGTDRLDFTAFDVATAKALVAQAEAVGRAVVLALEDAVIRIESASLADLHHDILLG